MPHFTIIDALLNKASECIWPAVQAVVAGLQDSGGRYGDSNEVYSSSICCNVAISSDRMGNSSRED